MTLGGVSCLGGSSGFSIDAGWSGAFAGKPAPTGIAADFSVLLAPSFSGLFRV